LLGGGIDECSSFLIYGTPHCGKKPVIMKILYTALKNKIPVILILTDFGVKRWKEMMQDSGWNLNRFKGRLYFIDAYSQQYSIEKDEDNITYLQVPYPLSTLSIECAKFMETCQFVYNKKPLVIMHSLSTLIEHFGEAEVFNFTQFFLGKLSNDCITSVYSMQKGMHSEKIETMITSMFDGTLEMKDMQLRARGYMDIATLEWVPYKMTSKGVVVQFKEEKKEKKKPKKKAKKPAKKKKTKKKPKKRSKKKAKKATKAKKRR
jgi:KaiC/GvpD/RAD55 family RecA-like ATPase